MSSFDCYVLDLAADAFDCDGNRHVSDKHEDKGFSDRLTHLDKEFKGVAVLMMKEGILPKAFQDLWSDEKLLNVAEQIVGPDIAGHPVWNIRPKVNQFCDSCCNSALLSYLLMSSF